MAEPVVSYIVDNDRRFRNALQRATDATKDLRLPFTLIQADFYRSEQAIFKLQGPGKYPPFTGSGGHYRKNKKGEKIWVDRSAFGGGSMSLYQAAKRRSLGFDYPLLVRSGKLAASVLGPNAPGSVAVKGPSELTLGTTIPYGIYHQSDQPRSKIPQRKFLFIGPEAPEFATSEQMGRPQRWMNILNDYVLKVLKNG